MDHRSLEPPCREADRDRPPAGFRPRRRACPPGWSALCEMSRWRQRSRPVLRRDANCRTRADEPKTARRKAWPVRQAAAAAVHRSGLDSHPDYEAVEARDSAVPWSTLQAEVCSGLLPSGLTGVQFLAYGSYVLHYNIPSYSNHVSIAYTIADGYAALSSAFARRRTNAAASPPMLSSPRKPSSTIRIFSSAEYCLRVARRMSTKSGCRPGTLRQNWNVSHLRF